MIEHPLVSIVMPVYKVEKYIQESVKSVLRQTYSNIELIVVDDGTPDSSIQIAESILSLSNITFQIIHQENAGLGYARNAGMDRASGKWVMFLDSDDMISDNAIEHLVVAGEKETADLVFSSYNEIYESDDAIRICKQGNISLFSAEEIQTSFLKRKNIVLAPGTLYRKKILDSNRLRFEKVPWSEDQHFIWRVLLYINKAVFIEEPLYQYLRHNGSIMDVTKISAMIDSYSAISKLESYYNANNRIGRYIVARWVMGTLNSATIMVDYSDWKVLSKAIELRKHFRLLLKFPDIKVKANALLGVIWPYLYFLLNKKRKHRGQP